MVGGLLGRSLLSCFLRMSVCWNAGFMRGLEGGRL